MWSVVGSAVVVGSVAGFVVAAAVAGFAVAGAAAVVGQIAVGHNDDNPKDQYYQIQYTLYEYHVYLEWYRCLPSNPLMDHFAVLLR